MTSDLLRDGEVRTFGANGGDSLGWSGRANFLSVAAIQVLGSFSFAVQYGIFKVWNLFKKAWDRTKEFIAWHIHKV